jgi:hypothetical protein
MIPIRDIARHLGSPSLSYRSFIWAGLALLACSSLFGIISSLKWGVFHDAGIYYYTAAKVLEGQAPYRDFFMMDMPATYLIYALGQGLLGTSDLAHRLFDLAWTGFIAAALILLCRKESLLAAISAVLFYFCLHISQGSDQMLQRDFLMVPFMLFAAYFVTDFLEKGKPGRNFFLCGFCIGWAAFIKPTALFLAPCLLAVTATHPRVGLRQFFLCCLYGALGGVAAAFPILLWLYVVGGLSSWWDLLIHFIPLYSQIGARPGGILEYQEVAAMLFTMAMASIYSPERLRYRNYVLFAGYIAGLFNFYLQPYGYIFRWCPSHAFFIAFCFLNIKALFETAGAFPKAVVIISLTTIYILFSPLYYLSQTALNSEWAWQSNTREAFVNDVIAAQESLAPELRDAGNQNTMHFFEIIGDFWYTATRLQTRSPSRCLSSIIFYLFNDDPYIQDLRRECLRDLEAAPPDVIGLNTFDYGRGLQEMDFSDSPDMANFIAANYRLFPTPDHVSSIGWGYKIYVRKTALPQPGQPADGKSYYFYHGSHLPAALGVVDDWSLTAEGENAGLLSSGPSVILAPGRYTLTMKYYTPDGNGNAIAGAWEAGYFDREWAPDLILARGNLPSTDNPGGATLESSFEVPADHNAQGPLQIRTYYHANGSLTLRSIAFSGPN